MTFVAARLVVEELPAALGRVVNRVLLTSDEVIERRVKRQLGSFVGGDGAQQVRAVGRAAKDDTESLLIFLDRCDPRHRCIQVGLTHLNGVDNRECSLFLERVHPTVPELSLIIESVQNGWGIALADAAFDAEGGGLLSVKASFGSWHVLHEMVPSTDRRGSKKSLWPSEIFSGVCGLSAGIFSRVIS